VASSSRALIGLAELLRRDLSQIDPDALVQGIKQAELVHDSAPEWSGRLLAVLHWSGASWPEIARLTELSVTTVPARGSDRPAVRS
jgi:hypothetical protein